MAKQLPEHQNSSLPPKVALPKSRKTIILLVVSALILVAAGAYAWLKLAGPGAPADNDNQNISQTNSGPFRTGPAADLPADSDGDGLTDQEEATLGTDSAKVDTDDDGLSDLDETRGYGTDPLDADSDDDTFKDGDEVTNRYDPNGPGQLLDLTSATNVNSTP